MRRSRRCPLFSVASVAAVSLAVALPGGAVASTGHSAVPRYERPERVCSTPQPGHVACFAIKYVPTSKGQPGARRVDSARARSSAYTPANLGAAYGFKPSVGGKGQTVAIVDWYDDPNILSDLNQFDATNGLPPETATSFRVLNQNGKASPLPPPDPAKQAETEEALDVEAVRGVCNHCKIVLFEADDSSLGSVITAVKSTAKVHATEISNSYGGPEPKGASKKVLAEYAAYYHRPGVVVTAANGDDGWFSWDVINGGTPAPSRPNIPSTLPEVVAVGGTTLDLTAEGTRGSETVWNNNGLDDSEGSMSETRLGATGGGCSTLFAAKRWQSHMPGYGKTGCTHRLAADVAAVGDPHTGFNVYDSYAAGGWVQVGGTSLSAPVIAGMWALAGGAHHIRYPSLTLYGHAFAKQHRPIYDVTLGGSAFCAGDSQQQCAAKNPYAPGYDPNQLQDQSGHSAGRLDCGWTASGKLLANYTQCVATKGYDGPSGVGTPIGLKLFAPLHPTAKITHSTARAHHATTFKSHAGDPFPGGSISKVHWHFGDGKTSSKLRPSHVYKKAGTFHVTVTVVDRYTVSRTVTATVHVHHS